MTTPCGPGANYKIYIDWFNTGTVAASGNDVTDVVLGEGSWQSSYGRDQARQLSPASPGRAAWVLCNVSREFSPENAASPLYGNIGPGRSVEFHVLWGATDYRLFTGRIDDFNIHVDFNNRDVNFTGLDGLADLRVFNLCTEVHQAKRTGDVINIILDEAGWPAGLRSIDPGATIIPYWWAEGTNALESILEMVQAEGPPAIAYTGPDGVFVFRDRHHRLIRDASLTSQATFSEPALGVC